MSWQLIFLLAWTLGFLYLVIRIEGYFIYKSIESLKNLRQAYKDMQESKKKLQEPLDKV